MMATLHPPAQYDLVLERIVDVPPALVWKAWTTPEHIKQWFTPAPWQTVACEMEVRPGGRFYTVMRSPEGEEFPNEGCFLEVIDGKKLVWTDALYGGFRPAAEPNHCTGHFFTAIIALAPHGANGTKYTVTAMHATEEGRTKHAERGFEQGWGAALDQLVALVKTW
jgi:uncharacterized protein YndB with AHSA1/START domain